jgi:hypothetical protein
MKTLKSGPPMFEETMRHESDSIGRPEVESPSQELIALLICEHPLPVTSISSHLCRSADALHFKISRGKRNNSKLNLRCGKRLQIPSSGNQEDPTARLRQVPLYRTRRGLNNDPG